MVAYLQTPAKPFPSHFVLLLLSTFLIATFTATKLNAAPNSSHSTPYIMVTGEGKAYAKPNQARFDIVFSDTQLKLEDAREKVDDDVRKLLKSLKTFEIVSSSIDSSNTQIHPRYEYVNRNSERRFLGYQIERRVSFKLNNLEQLDKLVKTISQHNINRLDHIQLIHDDPESIKHVALQNAIEHSKALANMIAESYDVALGKIHRVSYMSDSPRHAPMRMMAMEKASADMAPSYEQKDLEFTARVEVSFTFK